MQYILKRLKLPKSTEISENSDHSKSNYCRGFNLCAVYQLGQNYSKDTSLLEKNLSMK